MLRTNIARKLLALVSLTVVAGVVPVTAAPAADETGWHLWLGERYLGPAPAARDAARDLPPLLTTRRELVIVTTGELVSGSELLPRLVELRNAEGWDVTIATEADWDVPLGQGPDGRAERIRAYLADGWAHDPGAYALLIGDPAPEGGDIPMKEVHPLIDVIHLYDEWLADQMDPIPTDFYYADLTGEWDCDGDGQYGEYPDDAGVGCVDFEPELIVGRLPVYGGDAADLDTLLARAIARDLETDKSYRADVLDSPELDDAGDFGPGGSISWTAVPGAERHAVYILDGDMAAWWLLTDGTEVSFPRLPEDFDTSLFGEGGQWNVRASQYVEVDGEIDYSEPYLVSETPGGELVW